MVRRLKIIVAPEIAGSARGWRYFPGQVFIVTVAALIYFGVRMLTKGAEVAAFKNAYDTAVVVSNDSDLSEAIRVAQSELGVRVGIINPHPRQHRSRELLGLNCLFYKQVPRQLLGQAQLPAELHDSRGLIRKPHAWHRGT